jgi:hypothetical protein
LNAEDGTSYFHASPHLNVIAGFSHDVEICAVLGYYAVMSGNPLPTFQDNVSVPSSGVKKLPYSLKQTRGLLH